MIPRFYSARELLSGDTVFTPYDRDWARQRVNELSSLYQSTGYQPSRFAPAYQTLIEQSKKLGVWPSDYPQWATLGEQAEKLTAQIASATGAAPVPVAKPPGPSLPALPSVPTWAWWAGGAVVGGGVLWFLFGRRR